MFIYVLSCKIFVFVKQPFNFIEEDFLELFTKQLKMPVIMTRFVLVLEFKYMKWRVIKASIHDLFLLSMSVSDLKLTALSNFSDLLQLIYYELLHLQVSKRMLF